MKGKPVILLRPGAIPQPCSITLLMSLNTDDTFFVDIRKGSNTQVDFFECIKKWIQEGALCRGDILILDNATVHTAPAHGREIEEYMEEHEITLQTLPTYSPELNPCELIFARIKRYIKSTDCVTVDQNGRTVCLEFEEALGNSLGNVQRDDMRNLYRHCAYPQYR
jgi:GTPase SAR1 family protein